MVRVAVAFLFVLAMVSCPVGAAKPEFSVDFACGWDGWYRPMEWMPVEIGISSNLTEPFGGSLVLSGPQDNQNNLNIVHPFVLTPNVPLEVPLVTKLKFGVGTCSLTVRDERGRTLSKQTIDLWGPSGIGRGLKVVRDPDMLIGTTGQPLFGLLKLGDEAASISLSGSGKVYVGHKIYRGIPWDWTGFAGLDVFILYNPDWTQLRPEQVRAMCEWVSNGGTLLLVLGSHPLPPDSPLVQLIPFVLGQPRQTTLPTHMLTRWGLDSGGDEMVTAWPLSRKPGALLVDSSEDSANVFGAGPVGFGRVGVLSFDPAQLGEAHTAHSGAFWAGRIASCLPQRQVSTSSRPPGRGPVFMGMPAGGYGRSIVLGNHTPPQVNRGSEYQYQVGLSQNAVNQVLNYHYALKQMRPLSIWWVILILVSMAILLGPVDYLVLKKLDRLPLTWLTSTGWIVLFTIGAYYGVQALRGGRMQLRAVSVVDNIAGSEVGWATHYLGIFAPRSDEYELDGLAARQWWSGLASNAEWLHAQQSSLVARQIYCQQTDGSNLPLSVPINIWTVQSLVGEAPSKDVPFKATVERSGNAVNVEITNTSSDPIQAGCILFQDAYADIPGIAAGASQRLDRSTKPFNPWGRENRPTFRSGPGGMLPSMMAEGVPSYPQTVPDVAMGAFLSPGCLGRTLAMHNYLRQGGALVCVEFRNPSSPFRVKGRSYDASCVRWARQIVFPQNAHKE
jgi:hypothetical protein